MGELTTLEIYKAKLGRHYGSFIQVQQRAGVGRNVMYRFFRGMVPTDTHSRIVDAINEVLADYESGKLGNRIQS